jgi:hypothetical protein
VRACVGVGLQAHSDRLATHAPHLRTLDVVPSGVRELQPLFGARCSRPALSCAKLPGQLVRHKQLGHTHVTTACQAACMHALQACAHTYTHACWRRLQPWPCSRRVPANWLGVASRRARDTASGATHSRARAIIESHTNGLAAARRGRKQHGRSKRRGGGGGACGQCVAALWRWHRRAETRAPACARVWVHACLMRAVRRRRAHITNAMRTLSPGLSKTACRPASGAVTHAEAAHGMDALCCCQANKDTCAAAAALQRWPAQQPICTRAAAVPFAEQTQTAAHGRVCGVTRRATATLAVPSVREQLHRTSHRRARLPRPRPHGYVCLSRAHAYA